MYKHTHEKYLKTWLDSIILCICITLKKKCVHLSLDTSVGLIGTGTYIAKTNASIHDSAATCSSRSGMMGSTLQHFCSIPSKKMLTRNPSTRQAQHKTVTWTVSLSMPSCLGAELHWRGEQIRAWKTFREVAVRVLIVSSASWEFEVVTSLQAKWKHPSLMLTKYMLDDTPRGHTHGVSIQLQPCLSAHVRKCLL